SDYSKQELYKNLVESLDNDGLVQNIYVPTRTEAEIGKYLPVGDSVNVHYKYILRKKDRIFYFNKIKKIYNDLNNEISIKNISIIHAHFLFSDGGVAYQLKKHYNTPYIVAVRNTDVNFFLKYAIHLKKFGAKILLNAERIVFLTPAYRDA